MTNVWYIGSAPQRKISSLNWQAIGIAGAEDTLWEPLNGWSIDESTLSEEQLNVLDSEPDFLVGQEGPRSRIFPLQSESNILNSYVYYINSKEIYEKIQGSSPTVDNLSGAGTLGKNVVKSQDSAALWEAVGNVPANKLPSVATSYKVGAGTGTNATTDRAIISAAFTSNTVVRAENSTYLADKANGAYWITAGKRLELLHGAKIKLADGAVSTWGSNEIPCSQVILAGSNAAFIGTIDGNRANQSSTQYNLNPGQINGFTCYGQSNNWYSNVYVDAQIVNTTCTPAIFAYVKDSYIRIRAKDCGGVIAFAYCENLEVDIEYDNCDNLDWKIWQHAIDFSSCKNIRGRLVTRNQSSNGRLSLNTGLSDKWFTGVTITDCTDMHFETIDLEASSTPCVATGVGLSMIGIKNFSTSYLRLVGFSSVALEVGGVVNGQIGYMEIDGQYARSSDIDMTPYGVGSAINIYDNGGVSTSSTVFAYRTQQDTRNFVVYGGRVIRHGEGLRISAASETTWDNVSFVGNTVGARLWPRGSANHGTVDATANTKVILDQHTFVNCDFSFNQQDGFIAYEGSNVTFKDCKATNNNQAKTYGSYFSFNATPQSSAGFNIPVGEIFSTTAASGTGTVATLTLPSGDSGISNIYPGDTIKVAGVVPAGYNGTYTVTDVQNGRSSLPVTVSYNCTATGTQTVAGTIQHVTPKTNFQFINCVASDTQGSTNNNVFPNYDAPNRVAVDSVEKYTIGQVLVLAGAGVAGADLKVFVNDIVKDELIINSPVLTFPTFINGTFSTSTKSITGVETKFLTYVNSRAYVKAVINGTTYYRRILKVYSDTSALLETAFPSNISAGTNFEIVRTPSTTTHSQDYGYYFSSSLISPVFYGKAPTGNLIANIYDDTAPSTKPVGVLVPVASGKTGVLKVDGTNTTLDIQSPNGMTVNDKKVQTLNGVEILSTSKTFDAISGQEYTCLLSSGAAPVLPTAVGNTSKYHVKNIHTNGIVLTTTSSQTIDGDAAPILIGPKQCFTFVSDGSNWVII